MQKIFFTFILVIALFVLPAFSCHAKDQDKATDCQIQLKQKDLELVGEKLNRIGAEFAYMQERAKSLQQERAFLLSEQKRLQKEISESKPKKE